MQECRLLPFEAWLYKNPAYCMYDLQLFERHIHLVLKENGLPCMLHFIGFLYCLYSMQTA